MEARPIPEIDYLMSFFFAVLGVLFFLFTGLVLRHNRNAINLTFGFSTIFFGISSFLCVLAFMGIQVEVLGFTGNVIMIWAPLGMFLAGKLILDGRDGWKRAFSISVVVVFILITMGYTILYFVEGLKLSRSVFTGALIVSIALALTGYVFTQVFLESSDSPELRRKITFLLIGIGVGIIGVISAVLSSNDPFILPMELASVSGLIINIGIFTATLSFTNIPDMLRSIEIGTATSTQV